ncbi:MAG TPA: gamma-glutamyl-gamma-aminobutyrate hydrolase family protein [Tepidisphaeraceae bacterium]|nr:gamma-glutamyl-gamma-aminobutyrate hydrolase family protein [Tepidisphaeraceae bacterium]
MIRPLIGITSDHNAEQKQYLSPHGYAASVERAGGLPVILPYRADLSLIGQYLDRLNGILFSGGNDLDPAAYGESWHPNAVPVDPFRERFERALIAEVERRRLPALGVCLGSQLMNLHRGGAMNQFIPDLKPAGEPIDHRNVNRDWVDRHAVSLLPESLIARTLGKTDIVVNTSHKQSIRTAGRGLRVIATAPDGVIEGIEDPTLPLFMGVQWHPERMSDDADHRRLFELLIEKSSQQSP